MNCPVCSIGVRSWEMEAHIVSVHRTCPWCGPWTATAAKNKDACPTCNMTPGEHAYRLRILADSDAVFAQEQRAFLAARKA